MSTNWQEDERQRGEGEKTRREGNIIKKRTLKGSLEQPVFALVIMGMLDAVFFFFSML